MTRLANRRKLLTTTMAALAAMVARNAMASQTGPRRHIIRIRNFRYEPARLEVRPGDVVTWINEDVAPHTATGEEGDWDTGRLNRNQQESQEIMAGQSGRYFCRFHPAMKGELIIIP